MRRLEKLRARLNLRALGPVASVPVLQAALSGLGAFIALGFAAALSSLTEGTPAALVLIAPLGASAVLVFGAVSSPLAQPWPVIVGSTSSAVVALLVCALVPIHGLAIALSVGLAIVAMALLRATHPPGGAVALTVALASEAGATPSPWFALLPVAAGSLFLVLCAMAWARLTGRRYPMRQFGGTGPAQTGDPAPAARLGLNEAELRQLLADYRQSLNLGVEDLARLIGAAEMRAASQQTGLTTASDVMSRDLVTVGPEAGLDEISLIFRQHGFTSLPVISSEGVFLGVIFQLHLISALSRSAGEVQNLRAAEIMEQAPPCATAEASPEQLVTLLGENGWDAVMILEGQKIVGVVTQTDLIAALAREVVRRKVQGIGAGSGDQPAN